MKRMAIMKVYKPETTDWVHAVMVYHGTGGGITVFHDGVNVGTSDAKSNWGPLKWEWTC